MILNFVSLIQSSNNYKNVNLMTSTSLLLYLYKKFAFALVPDEQLKHILSYNCVKL